MGQRRENDTSSFWADPGGGWMRPFRPQKFLCVLAVTVAFSLAGCTRFIAYNPDGSKRAESWGAPLVARQSAFTITDQWLDEKTNTLHEVRISHNSDESVDAQIEMLKLLQTVLASYPKP